jgi:hypothetical protein
MKIVSGRVEGVGVASDAPTRSFGRETIES